ncbi:MAG: phosphatase PAP2 family protein [Lachnospiraceae bacterium]|nr:phosphatase PAP2 family protein [Lachnospiraceae bacterium]
MNKLKDLFTKYKHIVPLILYSILFLSWFGYLELTVTKQYRVIHMSMDDHIPFVEVFIIPYLLWYGYVAVVIAYFFFTHKDNYYRICLFLAIGMTIFLIISTLWPNGHHLRPYVMPRDNIFTYLVSHLYTTDTSTNLWPSIHVYNSLGAHIAVMQSERLSKNKAICWASGILCVSIILSTMLIKQHSVFDVITAFIMATVLFVIVYKCDIINAFRNFRPSRSKKPQVS